MMKVKDHNIQTGKLGENLARTYLEKKGYKIIDQNYRTKYAEIDLVAKEKDVLVVVEVRTKVGEQFGAPEDTLNSRKLYKVKKNAAAYAAHKGWSKIYRVDAVCIVLTGTYEIERINHYTNI